LLLETHGQQILGGRAWYPALAALLFRFGNEIVVVLGTMGDLGMFKAMLNLIAPFAVATLGVIVASIEPALAQVAPAPAPIVGAGLPALAILGGGYWLIRKLRRRR
jgi:hypothetical protein